jgi:hypothetical protein
MHRWLFAFMAIFISAPTQADDAAHPGRYLDTALYDDIGDSGYNWFVWCGEQVWLNGSSGMVVADPETGKILRRVSVGPNPMDYDLWGCSGSGDRMVFLLDHGRAGLVWKTLDGKSEGEISGVRRGRDSLRFPLIAMDETAFVGISVADDPLQAMTLPPGYRLVSIAPGAVKPFGDVDEAVGLSRIRHNLFSLDLESRQVLIEIDKDGTVTRHRNLSDIVPLSSDYFLSYPKPDGDALVVRAWDRGTLTTPSLAAKICRIEDPWQTPVKTKCHAAAEGEQAIGDRISVRLKNETVLVSPSGRWAVWGEEIEGDQQGNRRVYVAPTADLLKP